MDLFTLIEIAKIVFSVVPFLQAFNPTKTIETPKNGQVVLLVNPPQIPPITLPHVYVENPHRREGILLIPPKHERIQLETVKGIVHSVFGQENGEFNSSMNNILSHFAIESRNLYQQESSLYYIDEDFSSEDWMLNWWKPSGFRDFSYSNDGTVRVLRNSRAFSQRHYGVFKELKSIVDIYMQTTVLQLTIILPQAQQQQATNMNFNKFIHQDFNVPSGHMTPFLSDTVNILMFDCLGDFDHPVLKIHIQPRSEEIIFASIEIFARNESRGSYFYKEAYLNTTEIESMSLYNDEDGVKRNVYTFGFLMEPSINLFRFYVNDFLVLTSSGFSLAVEAAQDLHVCSTGFLYKRNGMEPGFGFDDFLYTRNVSYAGLRMKETLVKLQSFEHGKYALKSVTVERHEPNVLGFARFLIQNRFFLTLDESAFWTALLLVILIL